MTDTYSLNATKRDANARDKQAVDQVFAVVYGPKQDPTPLTINASDMLRTYRKAGMSSIVELNVDGKTIRTLIKELDLHPVRHEIRHVDFYAVDDKRKTTVKVPFKFVGSSPAVKNYGAVLAVSHDYVKIRCLPTEIPQSFDVSIDGLEEISDHINLGDLGIHEKYEIMHFNPNLLVCSVTGRKGKAMKEAEGGEAAAEETAAK